jgi:hypothetical protein
MEEEIQEKIASSLPNEIVSEITELALKLNSDRK